MGLGKKTIDDQNYCGKKVLVRCDFNVPMKDGVITNENRINAALPTIQKLVNDGAKVILCSHLGKPKNGPEAKFSLAPVAVALSAKLGTLLLLNCAMQAERFSIHALLDIWVAMVSILLRVAGMEQYLAAPSKI